MTDEQFTNRVRLLDTDVMIDLQRGFRPAVDWYASVPPGTLALPGHALMELYQDAQNMAQNRVVDQITAPFPIIWPTDEEAIQGSATSASCICRRALAWLTR